MSIRYKFFFAFTVLVALACSLALFGFRGIATSGDLVVRLYDGPLMGINHARSAHAALNEARLLVLPDLGDGARSETIAKFQSLLTRIDEDLKIVRERVNYDDVAVNLKKAESRIDDWADTALKLLKPPPGGLTMVPTILSVNQKSNDAVLALDDLVETVAAFGFGFRMDAEGKVVAARVVMLALASGTTLIGLLLAGTFAVSMSRPIFLAVQIAEKVAAGNFNDEIAIGRGDEFGRLLSSLAVMQRSLRNRTDENQATTAKLDAALNNMTQGLCMFSSDNKLLLWNQRYLEMYRIAPDQISTGFGQEQMLEAIITAGTGYRDLEHYAANLKTAATSRSPEGFTADLVDGRIVYVSYQPIDNGGWASTHEDVTERKEKLTSRILHLTIPSPNCRTELRSMHI
jgi:PAS domain-containing protein